MKVLYIICTFFILISCNERKRLERKVSAAFSSSLLELTGKTPEHSSIYMVIPRAGCGGCISSAETFMLNFLKDSSAIARQDELKFVLTNFDSEKILRARFGDAMNKPQILIDRNNIFTANQSLKSIYPLIFFFDEEGNLKTANEVSPQEDGLAMLSKELKLRQINSKKHVSN